MAKIVFAAISPHPPIILPTVGSPKDRAQVKNTIVKLEKLGEKLKEKNPEKIIISAPHPDWGFEVPLHFLNSKFKNQNAKLQFKIQNYQNPNNITIKQSLFNIYPILTTLDSPQQHYKWGRNLYLKIKNLKLKIAFIASGDMSHCLKEEGPYGFHPDGPKFDNVLIEALNPVRDSKNDVGKPREQISNGVKKKDIETILKLDELYPEAGECGLRSFCFLLGILEASGISWQPEILSYEGPFGVGYLVVNFKL